MLGPSAPQRGGPPRLCQPHVLRVVKSSCYFLVLRHLWRSCLPWPSSFSSFFVLPMQRQVEVNVRNKILYLIQAWAHAFRNEPKYKVVQDTYQIMKVEGALGCAPGRA